MKEKYDKNSSILISVIIPSFNYAHYLRTAVDSVLDQSFPNFELIIVDDGSSDDSLAIALSYKEMDQRVKVLTHPKHSNLGLTQTLKLGLSCASGQWIVFLESDDWLESDYLETKLSASAKNECGIIVNKLYLEFEKDADPTWQLSYVPRVQNLLQRICQRNDSRRKLSIEILKENLIPTFSCVMVKRKTLDSINWTPPVDKWLDWYLWVQVLQTERVLMIDDFLSHWRIHSNSWNRRKSLFSYIRDVKKFRKKIKALIYQKDTTDKSYKIAILSLPFIFLLARRLYLSCLKSGAVPILKQVVTRLGL